LAGFDQEDFGSPAEYLAGKYLTKNFARRFVNGWIVIIRMSHRYVEDNDNAARREIFFVSQQRN
jgi:hypothetical protein